MEFGDLFKRGWRITWNNKYLYALGFLAALGGSGASGGGGGGGTNNATNIPTDTGDFSGFEDLFSDIGKDLGAEFGVDPTVVRTAVTAGLAICAILFLIFLVFWFIRFIAEAGMIKNVSRLNAGEQSNFREAFADGRPYMMKFFFTRLIFLIPSIVVFVIMLGVGIYAFFFASDSFGSIMAIVVIPIIFLGCLLVPYNLFVSLLYPIAQRGIVFKDLVGFEAIKYAWNFLKKHVGDILILAFLLLAIGVVVGIVTFFVAVPVLVLSGIPAFLTAIDGAMPSVGSFTLLGAGFILMILISTLISSIFITFRSASFTLAYLEMDSAKPEDDLEVVLT